VQWQLWPKQWGRQWGAELPRWLLLDTGDLADGVVTDAGGENGQGNENGNGQGNGNGNGQGNGNDQ
jgi:hypothetical protein